MTTRGSRSGKPCAVGFASAPARSRSCWRSDHGGQVRKAGVPTAILMEHLEGTNHELPLPGPSLENQ
ncbi:hypothetical protein M514_06446 [Trichuris suis]|uniref:Uncharacterized protein n=1 Tax=Trichuris suis TaxID=68888 RepID=A0A085N1Z8_9BILA|nr:hypothetical protein M513_06446 [Trichuris suis]KFD63494.1 hypothetical protein M514_06446 [Trichuris suis]